MNHKLGQDYDAKSSDWYTDEVTNNEKNWEAYFIFQWVFFLEKSLWAG